MYCFFFLFFGRSSHQSPYNGPKPSTRSGLRGSDSSSLRNFDCRSAAAAVGGARQHSTTPVSGRNLSHRSQQSLSAAGMATVRASGRFGGAISTPQPAPPPSHIQRGPHHSPIGPKVRECQGAEPRDGDDDPVSRAGPKTARTRVCPSPHVQMAPPPPPEPQYRRRQTMARGSNPTKGPTTHRGRELKPKPASIGGDQSPSGTPKVERSVAS